MEKEFMGTEGKWYLQKYTDAYTNIIRCDDGRGNKTLLIAYTPQINLPEYRANAKLVAAAPDLLQACISALKDVQTINKQLISEGKHGYILMENELYVAISKALD